jgi:outer membrane protein OmpA-like peptidoglycan-associated protein
MRTPIFLLGFLLASASAMAQVTVDPRGLEGLNPPAPKPAPAKPAPHSSAPKPAPAKPAATNATPKPPPAPPPAPSTGVTIRPTPGAAGVPSVPAAAPSGPSIPPPLVVPTRPAPAPTPPTISADSPSSTTPLQGGLRVLFGAGRADINPAVDTSIRNLTRGTGPVAADGTSYTVTTYAAGAPEDPSTPRRLSLSRALTVRSVLISQGVPSVRIFVKALGPASPGFADGPPDRADIVVAVNPIPTSAAKPATTTPAATSGFQPAKPR